MGPLCGLRLWQNASLTFNNNNKIHQKKENDVFFCLGLPHDYEFSPPRRDEDDDQMSSTISITSDSSINNMADADAETSNIGKHI